MAPTLRQLKKRCFHLKNRNKWYMSEVIMQLLMFSKKYVILNTHIQIIGNRKNEAVKLNIFYNFNFIINIQIYEEQNDKYHKISDLFALHFLAHFTHSITNVFCLHSYEKVVKEKLV